MDVIICFDPGVTTGYCVLEYIPGLEAENLTEQMILESGTLSMWRGVEALMDQYKGQIHAIVVEQFRLYRGRAAQAQGFSTMDAARVIGAILVLAEQRGLMVIEQGASITKGIRIPDKVFQSLIGPHIKDAVMHGLVYLAGKKGNDKK